MDKVYKEAIITCDCGSIVILREKSDVNSPVAFRLPVDTVVQAKRQNKEWSKVSYDGKECFVMNQFLIFT